MATFHVWSDASGTADGSTWTNAFRSIKDALGDSDVVAGSLVLVHHSHDADLGTSPMTITSAGTLASPIRIICVDKENANAASTGAKETVSNALSLRGSYLYYGIEWRVGNPGNNHHLYIGGTSNTPSRQIFENCTLYMNSGATGVRIYLGNGNYYSDVVIRKCLFRFGSAAQSFRLEQGPITISDCSFTGTCPSTLLSPTSVRPGPLRVSGCDLSAFSQSFKVVEAGAPSHKGTIFVANCRMPSNWTPTIFSETPSNCPETVILENCSDGPGNWRAWMENTFGKASKVNDTYRSRGAAQDGTSISWRVETSAYCSDFSPFQLPLATWNDTTGGSRTVRVEVTTDRPTALTEGEADLVVEYLGSADYPCSTQISDGPGADPTCPWGRPHASGTTAQAASSAPWVRSSAATTEHKQALSVSITPNMKGWFRTWVRVKAASTILNVCPKLEIH